MAHIKFISPKINVIELTFLFRYFLVLIVLVSMQLPFLDADADYGLGGSRGPFTDEALYTTQFRNFNITGYLDITETDGLIKEPVFAAWLWLVTQFTSDTMQSCRTVIMVTSASFIAFLAAGSGVFSSAVMIAIPLGFLSFYVFQYSHFVMAEILCSLLILASCKLLYEYLRDSGGLRKLATSSFLVFLAYACKIQFIYAAFIPPLTIALAMTLKKFSGFYLERREWINLLTSVSLIFFFFILFFLAWIFPNFELWTYVVFGQAGKRSAAGKGLFEIVFQNMRLFLIDRHNWPIFIMLPFGTVAALREWSVSGHDCARRQGWIALLAPLSVWLALESHKLCLSYLPDRYLVSFYIALAMLVAAGLASFKRTLYTGRSKWAVFSGVTALALLLVVNGMFYQHLIRDRKYSIRDAQLLFASGQNWKGKVVMGAWAPTLFWGTGAIALPVWRGYFNDHDIMARYKPSAIVSEVGQQDSEGAFAADGIDLTKFENDLVRVGKWEIRVYKIPMSTGFN